MWRPWLSWLGKREKGWNRFVPRLVALHAFTHTHTHCYVFICLSLTVLGMRHCRFSSGSLWESAPSHNISCNQHQECKHFPDLLLTKGILQVMWPFFFYLTQSLPSKYFCSVDQARPPRLRKHLLSLTILSRHCIIFWQPLAYFLRTHCHFSKSRTSCFVGCFFSHAHLLKPSDLKCCLLWSSFRT